MFLVLLVLVQSQKHTHHMVPHRSALAALCDNQGRVLVFDVLTCVVVWMIKGYRHAQVAWAPTTPNAPLQLYVYAPLRAAVELWDMRSASKIAACSLHPVPSGQRAPWRVLLTTAVCGREERGCVWLLDVAHDQVFLLGT